MVTTTMATVGQQPECIVYGHYHPQRDGKKVKGLKQAAQGQEPQQLSSTATTAMNPDT